MTKVPWNAHIPSYTSLKMFWHNKTRNDTLKKCNSFGKGDHGPVCSVKKRVTRVTRVTQIANIVV